MPESGVQRPDASVRRTPPESVQGRPPIVTDDTAHLTGKATDIFISYAREDRPRVQPLAEALTLCGWSVWWDRDLVPGERFRDVIEGQLKSARCVVVVWSTHSVKSDFVLDEAAEAHDRHILVAVRFDDVPVPFGFRQIQTADLVGWGGDPAQQEFRRLVAGAESLIGRAPVPPVPAHGYLHKLSELVGKVPARAWVVTAVAAVIAVVVAVTRPQPHPSPPPLGPIVVGVMDFEAQQLGPHDEWMRSNTRDSLNAILSKVSPNELCIHAKEKIDRKVGPNELCVYSKEKIDFLREKRGLSEIEAAEALGINKMIRGTVSAGDSGVNLEVRVVDIESGYLQYSVTRTRPKSELIELQNEAAEGLLAALHIQLTQERRRVLFANRTKGTPESYKLLSDTLTGFTEEEKPTSLGPASPNRSESFAWGIAIAHAQVARSPEEATVREFLEQYRKALEAEKVEGLAELQLEMNEQQTASLRRYFDNAKDLRVQISDVDVTVEGNEALATFTRTDKFTEVPTGRDVQLEVRLSTLLTKQDGRWKIRGLRKPS